MSTRSDIIVQRADGSWSRQYCHFDGYLEGVGVTLLEHYSDQSRADELSALGALSVLAESPRKPAGHSFAAPVEGYCIAYGRDRGDRDCGSHFGETLESVWPAEDSWTEYTYVFSPKPGGSNEPEWYVGDPDLGPSSLVPLRLALTDPENFAPLPDVKSPFDVLWSRDKTRTA